MPETTDDDKENEYRKTKSSEQTT